MTSTSEKPSARESPTSPGEEAAVDDRPTVSPPFDLEAYAKASEQKVRAARSGPVPDAPEPADTSTKPPPANFELDPLPPAVSRPPRAPQITLTDEAELEQARINSVLIPSEPPRRAASSMPRASVSRPSSEDPPPTLAYPAEYEKDPFASLSEDEPPTGVTGRLVREMRDKFSLGDYTGALETAEAILQGDPRDDEAVTLAEESRGKLLQMYQARIGPMDRVPVVMVPREQLRWLSIDHRAGFLLSHIDGVSSLEMILDVSGMPLLDALKILAELQQQRVISFR